MIPLGFRLKEIIRIAKRRPISERTHIEFFSNSKVDDKAIFQEAKKINVCEYTEKEVDNSMYSNAVLSDKRYYNAIKSLIYKDTIHPLWTEDINEITRNILEVARYAPSAKNLQSVEFIIVRSNFVIKRIGEFYHRDFSHLNMVCFLIGNRKRAGQVRKVSSHSSSSRERGEKLFVYLDGGAAIANMSLAIRSMGYRAEWIYNGEESTSIPILRMLNVPTETFVYLGMIPLTLD